MGLTSPALLVVVVLAAVAAVVLTVLAWGRVRGRPWLRVGQRGLLVVLCQATAVLVVAAAANQAMGFYSSWSDLVGGSTQVRAERVVPGRLDNQVARLQQQTHTQGVEEHGVVVPLTIAGARSHITEPAYVYLPPQYSDPAYKNRRFPVVQLFDGYPGSPASWYHGLHAPTVLDNEIAAGRSLPFVAVMATQTTSTNDTECVNVVHGPQEQTYLTQDVPQTIEKDFRVQPTRWGGMGYSTGGFCAVNLALRDPGQYAAAVAMSGNYESIHGSGSGLYDNNRRLLEENSPTWYLKHHLAPLVHVLGFASAQDSGTVPDLLRFAAAARHGTVVQPVVLRHGGHNPDVWRAEEPYAWDWLSAQLGASLAPAVGLQDVPSVLPQHALRRNSGSHDSPSPSPSPGRT